MKKIISLLLAVFMLTAVLSACTPAPETPEGSTESTPESSEETPAPPPETKDPVEEAKENLSVPEGIELEGKTVTVAYGDGVRFALDVSEENIFNIVDQASYNKTHYAEKLLGTEIEYRYIRNFSSSTTTAASMWCDQLKLEMSNPFNNIDLYAAPGTWISVAMVRGLSRDLTPYDALDLSNARWQYGLEDVLSLKGELHYVTGDISPELFTSMAAVYFNKNSAAVNGGEDIYGLVKSGEWTFEKFCVVAGSTYEDIDGIDGKSKGDIFSLALPFWTSDALMMSSGYEIMGKSDKAGTYFVESDYLYGNTVKSVMNDIVKLSERDSVWVQPDYESTAAAVFFDGMADFYIDYLSRSSELNEKSDISFGFVPAPAYEKGGKLVTSVSHNCLFYSMAHNTEQPEIAATVLDVLGYFSEKETTDAVYQLYISSRRAGSAEDREMFEIIKKGVRFDNAKLFDYYLNDISDVLPSASASLKDLSKTYTSIVKTGFKKNLNSLNSKLKAAIG